MGLIVARQVADHHAGVNRDQGSHLSALLQSRRARFGNALPSRRLHFGNGVFPLAPQRTGQGIHVFDRFKDQTVAS